MKLKELYDYLGIILSREPNRGELDVKVPLANSSIGPAAATSIKSIGEGFDWDNGVLFLKTEEVVYHPYPTTWESIKSDLKKRVDINERLWPDKKWLHRERLTCWKEGYLEGYRSGMEHRLQDQPPFIYLINCTSFSSDIYSEEHVHTKFAFPTKDAAEIYILENGLLDQYEDVTVFKVPIEKEKLPTAEEYFSQFKSDVDTKDYIMPKSRKDITG